MPETRRHRTRRLYSVSNLVPQTRHPIVTWWYGRLIPNTRDATQPSVEVLFRELDQHDRPTERTYCFCVPVGALARVSLGSIWQHGREIRDFSLEERDFTFSLSPEAWKIVPALHKLGTDRYLIPSFRYPLLAGHGIDKANSWVLWFTGVEQRSLVVPCVEFFIRTFGHSGEVHRILVTYPWEEARKRLFGSLQPELPATGNRWPVHPGRYLSKSDVPFLAHLAFDPGAGKAARFLWAQRACEDSRRALFLKVRPWQRGQLTLRVLGRPLDDRRFLGLRITGMSYPESAPIDLLVEEPAPVDKNENSVSGSSSVPTKICSAPQDDFALSKNEPPNHGYGHFSVSAPKLIWFGSLPEVHVKRVHRPRSEEQGRSHAGSIDRLSTGDPFGSPHGVGKAVFQSPITMETRGTLWEAWRSCLHLKSIYPDPIMAVGYFTLQNGVEYRQTPTLIPFPALEKGRENWTWPYLDRKTLKRRGLLVISIKTPQTEIYILEIARRTNGATGSESENFRGLVFAEHRRDHVARYIHAMVSCLPESAGVFTRNVLAHCGASTIVTFKHFSRAAKFPLLETYKNALRKVHVELS